MTAFTDYTSEVYELMQGASGMLSMTQQADGKFQMMSLRDQLGLTQAQKNQVKDAKAAKSLDDEPHFWVHYDRDMEEISIAAQLIMTMKTKVQMKVRKAWNNNNSKTAQVGKMTIQATILSR